MSQCLHKSLWCLIKFILLLVHVHVAHLHECPSSQPEDIRCGFFFSCLFGLWNRSDPPSPSCRSLISVAVLTRLDAGTPVLSLSGQINKLALSLQKNPFTSVQQGRIRLRWSTAQSQPGVNRHPSLEKVKHLGGLADWSQGYLPVRLKEAEVEWPRLQANKRLRLPTVWC